MQDVQQRFAQGIGLLQSGNADQALRVFKSILKAFPRNPDTLYYVGLAHLELGQRQQAFRSLQRAHAAEPNNPNFANAMGLCLQEQGRTADAVAAFEEAAKAAPDLLQARYNLGSALQALGRKDTAVRELEAALSLAPTNRDVRLSLAGLYREGGAYARAIETARPLLEQDANDVRAFEEVSRSLLDAGAFADLKTLCESQLSGDKTVPWAHHRLMEVYLRLGDGKAAAGHGEQAVSLQPRSVHFRHGYAWALDLIGETDAATDAFNAVLEIQPDHKEALLRQAARTFIEERRWDAALWANRLDEAAGISPVRARNWEGGEIPNKSLIVLGEQGVGDQIMFAGLFHRAAAATDRLTVECEDRLIPLFRRSFEGLTLVPWSHPADAAVIRGRYDRKLPMADLIGLGPPTPRDAYLKADPARTAGLARKYRAGGARFLVGVSWQSGNAGNGPFRSVPLEQWGPVLQSPDCAFVNLQYGQQGETLRAAEAALGVTVYDDPDIDPLKDLDAFAAQVAATDAVVDAVVTVDNSTAHMAGALGVPTLLLLPVAADWRWLRTGADTLWYRSVSLIRQAHFGRWDDVIVRAAAELAPRLRVKA